MNDWVREALSVNVPLASISWIHVEFERHSKSTERLSSIKHSFVRYSAYPRYVNQRTLRRPGTMISGGIWASKCPTLNMVPIFCSSQSPASIGLNTLKKRCSIQWCWKCWKWAYAFGGDDDWRCWWWWRTKEAAENGITCLNENIITLWKSEWLATSSSHFFFFCDKTTDNSKLISLLSIVFSNLSGDITTKNSKMFSTWNQTLESRPHRGNWKKMIS